jgi:hypothetical protein
MKTFFQHGWHGWLIVIAVMIAWDVGAALTNGQTLTAWTRAAATQPLTRWVLGIAFGLLFLHFVLPGARFDPLDRFFSAVQHGSRTRPPV